MRILTILLCFVLSSLYGQTSMNGPFQMNGTVWYFIHSGGPLEIKAEAEYNCRGTPEATPSALFTVLDPEEKIVKFIYWRDTENKKRFTASCRFENAEKGIWQVRGTHNSGWDFHFRTIAVPQKEFGVLASKSKLLRSDIENLSGSWFAVPADAGKLRITTTRAEAELFDDAGASLGKVSGSQSREFALKGGTFCRIVMKQTAALGMIAIENFPVIYCTSRKAAETIAGSTVQDCTGRPFPHRFQAEMRNWMLGLKPEELRVETVDLKTCKDKFDADPAAYFYCGLSGPFTFLKPLLDSQNLDVKSPDYGRIPQDSAALGVLLALDRPFNPYFRHSGLKNRMLLSHFNSLLKLKESGSIKENALDYGGYDAMDLSLDYIAFALTANQLDPRLRSLWATGLAMPLLRYAFNRVSAENQSAHWIYKLHCLYEGTGETIYRTLAENFVKDMANPQRNKAMKVGYLQEGCGPDATYQGISAAVIAFYYLRSGNPEARELLKKIYRFMNLSTAPEKNGTFIGASGFSHRTKGSWCQRQWNGGTPLMASVLPEAALWHQNEPPIAASKYDALLTMDPRGNRTAKAHYAASVFAPHWYSYPERKVLKAKHPVLASSRFTENFNSEFLALRRPRYYLFAFLNSFTYPWRVDQMRSIWTNQVVKKGIHPDKTLVAAPPLQGPQLFWTPEAGSLIASRNWSPETHWNLLAQQNGQTIGPDSKTIRATWSDQEERINWTGTMTGNNMKFSRVLTLAEDGLHMEISVESAENLLWTEQLPVIEKDGVPIHAEASLLRIGMQDCGMELKLESPGRIIKGKRFCHQNNVIQVYQIVPDQPCKVLRYKIRTCSK